MNANQIISDNMTLEEKLEAIDKAMMEAQFDFNKKNGRELTAPIDPSSLLICDGCE